MTPVDHHDDPHVHADVDSDSDSLDDTEINNTAYPSAAFMMASAQSSQDDSFGSSSSHSGDSLTAEDNADLGLAPVHPFAMGVEDTEYDDTFDDDMYEGGARADQPDEETLFGVPPQQRIRAAQVQRLGQGHGQEQQGLRMLGEDLLQDTIGIGAQIAMRGSVEESPTPASQVPGSR
jgi:DASH complex subunit ASK1